MISVGLKPPICLEIGGMKTSDRSKWAEELHTVYASKFVDPCNGEFEQKKRGALLVCLAWNAALDDISAIFGIERSYFEENAIPVPENILPFQK